MKGSFQSVLLVLVPVAFIVVGLSMAGRDLYKYLVYEPVEMEITGVERNVSSEVALAIEYRYTVGGTPYTGSYETSDNGTDYDAVRDLEVGHTHTGYFDPNAPSVSAPVLGLSTFPLVFALFAMPFLVLTLNDASLALRGRRVWKSTAASEGATPVPGGSAFVVSAVLCTFGGIGAGIGAEQLGYPNSVLAFLGYGLVFIPLAHWVTWRLTRDRPKGTKRRRRGKASRGETADAGNETSGESLVDQLPPLARMLIPTVLMTLLFLTIPAVAGIMLAGEIVKAGRTADWSVTSGEVITSQAVGLIGVGGAEGGGLSYLPYVRYRYRVGDQWYEADRLSFGYLQCESQDQAAEAAAPYRVGTTVQVYYDPEAPQEAVLQPEAVRVDWFAVVLLSGILFIGLSAAVWVAKLPATRSRVVRFLREPVDMPWPIPTWGVMDLRAGCPVVESRLRRGEPARTFAFGFGIATLVALVVIMLAHGSEASDFWPGGVLVAAAVGAAFGLWRVRRRKRWRRSTVTFDTMRKEVRVQSPMRDESARFDEISCWHLREVLYPSGLEVNESRKWYLLLEALLKDGRTLPVHRFRLRCAHGEGILLVIRRLQDVFAELTDSSSLEGVFRPEMDEDAPRSGDAEARGSIRALFQSLGLSHGPESHSDLR